MLRLLFKDMVQSVSPIVNEIEFEFRITAKSFLLHIGSFFAIRFAGKVKGFIQHKKVKLSNIESEAVCDAKEI